MRVPDLADFSVGTVLFGETRVVSHERTVWYGLGVYTAITGEVGAPRANIHTDDASARSQGLPAAIAAGMLSTKAI